MESDKHKTPPTSPLTKNAFKIKPSALPIAVILAGILFTLYLQFQIPEGVFYSGDAGLKALLAKQLSGGQFRFDLAPPSISWVQNLWKNDFYPFKQPFVYFLNNRYYITFPYTFPLVTAPFYSLFGYAGLYIIPLVSTWALWWSFYRTCRRLKFSILSTSIALAILIFASHLTVYSAMYWEHTLAVALAFYGFSTLLIPGTIQGISKKDAVLSGISIGLSVWFRPEFLCLVAILLALVYFVSLSNLKFLKSWQVGKLHYLTKNREIFVASMLVTIGIFFLTNKLIYNHPLGIHAIQVVEQQTLPQRLAVAWNNFRELLLDRNSSVFLFKYLPIAVLPLLYLPISFIAKKQVKLNIKLAITYLICFLFIVGVSLMVPAGAGGKQWGPRFLLILVPIITILAIQELQLILRKAQPGLKYSCLFAVALMFVFGLHQNTFLGTANLVKNYQGILPAIQFLDKEPNQFIGMSHEYVAQVLEPGIKQDKIFFRAEDSPKLVQLGKTLAAQGQQTFIYVCYPFRPCTPPKDKPENLKFTQGNQSFTIKLSKLGVFGRYPIYKAAIAKNAATKPS